MLILLLDDRKFINEKCIINKRISEKYIVKMKLNIYFIEIIAKENIIINYIYI